MEKWYLKNIKADLDTISKRIGISKILARIISNRRIKDLESIADFISPNLEKLHNPRLMKDIELGANIMKDSINNGERIRIAGDYDQDGNSAILTLYNGIKRCGGNVDYVIPHRILDGYGINDRIVKEAKADGIELIITCDNGISAFNAVELAKHMGIKVIVTDHHDVCAIDDSEDSKGYVLPEADAVINPKRPDCNYPFKALCGAGVAFKFLQILYEEFGIDVKEAYEMLEFVAMATVCDVVDLLDENRIIVAEGLRRINRTKNMGLKALIKATGLEGKEISAYSLGFVLGPCINASGRLDNAEIAVELFLTNDRDKAKEYAEKLFELNKERKEMTEKGYKKIVGRIESDNILDNKIFVMYEPHIHESIIGIIAGRIKERYYRPTIIFTDSKDVDVLKGSGRSVEEYNMFDGISECRELLLGFGGHPMAAGMSLEISKLKEFRDDLNKNTVLSNEDLLRKRYIDVHLSLDYLTFNLIEELKLLEPYGKGNPRPLFADKGIRVKRMQILGRNKNVLKLVLLTRNGRTIDGLYFGDIDKFKNRLIDEFGENEVNKTYRGFSNEILIDIIYTPNINEYMGKRNLQIIIQNYR